jgi:hypothetical protein
MQLAVLYLPGTAHGAAMQMGFDSSRRFVVYR